MGTKGKPQELPVGIELILPNKLNDTWESLIGLKTVWDCSSVEGPRASAAASSTFNLSMFCSSRAQSARRFF
jgi:hypothetical protein